MAVAGSPPGCGQKMGAFCRRKWVGGVILAALPFLVPSCRTYPDLPSKSQSLKLYVIVDQLAVRGFADPAGAVITHLREGAEVKPTGRISANANRIELRGREFDEHWIEAQLADGRTGWIFGGGLADQYPPGEGTLPEHFGLSEKGKFVLYSTRGETAIKSNITVNLPLPEFSSYDAVSGLALLEDRDPDSRRRVVYYLDRNAQARIRFEDHAYYHRISDDIGYERTYTPFREGFAFIGLVGDEGAAMDAYLSEQSMESRFIDAEGRTYLKFKGAWRSAGFHNGAAVLVSSAGVHKDNHILIVHRNGRIIDLPGIRPAFDGTVNTFRDRHLHFQEGLFPVQSGPKSCAGLQCHGLRYIDTNGREVVRAPRNAIAARHFFENYAVVTIPDEKSNTGRHVLLERFGNIRSGDYITSSDVKGGLFMACTKFVNDGGYPGCPQDTVFSVSMDSKGRLNDSFEKRNCKQDLYPFFVRGNGQRFGYKSCSTDRIAIPPQFDDAEPFANGYARVLLQNRRAALIDGTGKIRWQSEE